MFGIFIHISVFVSKNVFFHVLYYKHFFSAIQDTTCQLQRKISLTTARAIQVSDTFFFSFFKFLVLKQL